jgi:serine/threonine protein kinase
MLIKNNDLKIADFSISSFLTATLTNSESGTPAYQAPEIWNRKGSNLKSDVW